MMQNQELKILLISPVPPPAGGIATWTQQYIEWSKINHFNVDIVNTALVGKRAENIKSKSKLIDEIQRTTRIVKDIIFKVKKHKPNIIHINTSCSELGIIRDYLCARIGKRKGIKIFIHYRCNIEDQVGKKLIQNYFLKKLANIADRNLVLNNLSKKFLSNKLQKDSTLIANFIDESYLLTKPKEIKETIRVITFVGHLNRSKGIFEIFEAARSHSKIIFNLAGPASKFIKGDNLPSNVRLLGALQKEEVRNLLYQSDVFLFPSYTEGFANSLLEAMAMGLPIITTPVGANKDMLESSGGVFVDIANSSEIVCAINHIKNLDVRLKMARWNIDKVKREYTTDKIMRKLISLYLD